MAVGGKAAKKKKTTAVLISKGWHIIFVVSLDMDIALSDLVDARKGLRAPVEVLWNLSHRKRVNEVVDLFSVTDMQDNDHISSVWNE